MLGSRSALKKVRPRFFCLEDYGYIYYITLKLSDYASIINTRL